MAKQKKQFRELSDEELKQVNGGASHLNLAIYAKLNVDLEQFHAGVPDENGNCPQM